MTFIHGALYDTQRVLSRGQAIPIVGLLVSPIKIAVGIVQVVAGIAIGVFAGLGFLITKSQPLINVAEFGFNEMFVGGSSIGYAVANIVTLGILGFCVESNI